MITFQWLNKRSIVRVINQYSVSGGNDQLSSIGFEAEIIDTGTG
jgi:hypothetical protein